MNANYISCAVFCTSSLSFYILKAKVCSLLRHSLNFHSNVAHELFFLQVFICLFFWEDIMKGYLKITSNRAVTPARQIL